MVGVTQPIGGEARGRQQQPAAHHDAVAVLADHVGAEPRRDHAHGPDGQARHRGPQRRVAVGDLEVLGDREVEAVHREELEGDGGGAHLERPHREQAHVEHGPGVVALPQHERHDQGHAADERGDGDRVGPAAARPVDDPVEQAAHGTDGEDHAEGVERGVGGIRRVGQQERAREQRHRADHHVDEERRRPVVVGQQQACGDRSQRPAQPRAPRPHGDGPLPLPGVAEDVGEDRQGARHDERRTEPGEATQRDELPVLGGEGGGERGEGEDHQPELQRRLAAVAVGQRPGGEQQHGEHEAVRVDHPLLLAGAGAEGLLDVGQGHVQRRVPGHDQQQAQAEHGQDRPAPLVDVGVDAVQVAGRGLGDGGRGGWGGGHRRDSLRTRSGSRRPEIGCSTGRRAPAGPGPIATRSHLFASAGTN